MANIIEVKDQETFVKELYPIEQAIRTDQPLLPHKYIKQGQRCCVTVGPLEGIEGIVVRTPQQTRLVLQVDILGQATSVEIDMDMIEILD